MELKEMEGLKMGTHPSQALALCCLSRTLCQSAKLSGDKVFNNWGYPCCGKLGEILCTFGGHESTLPFQNYSLSPAHRDSKACQMSLLFSSDLLISVKESPTMSNRTESSTPQQWPLQHRYALRHCGLAWKRWLLSVGFRNNQILGNVTEISPPRLFIVPKLGDAKWSSLIKVVWGEPQQCELRILLEVPKHDAQHPEPMTGMWSRASENVAIKYISWAWKTLLQCLPTRNHKTKLSL